MYRDRVIYIVKWNNHTQNTYLYGSTAEFGSDGCVHFANNRMPSGQVIRHWASHRSYPVDRAEPQLPFVLGGTKYRIRSMLSTEPAHSFLWRMRFYDRSENIIGEQYVSRELDEFKAPEGTDYWDMDLISSGMETLRFHHVEIEPVIDGLDASGNGIIRPKKKNIQEGEDPDWNIVFLNHQSKTVHIPEPQYLKNIESPKFLTIEEAEWMLLQEGTFWQNTDAMNRNPLHASPLVISFIGYDELTCELAEKVRDKYRAKDGRYWQFIKAKLWDEHQKNEEKFATALADRSWRLKSVDA